MGFGKLSAPVQAAIATLSGSTAVPNAQFKTYQLNDRGEFNSKIELIYRKGAIAKK